jgi:hypothetical protein
MNKQAAVAAADQVQEGLLDLSSVRLRALVLETDPSSTSTLDSVMKRLFDPRERDLLTVSAFASAL